MSWTTVGSNILGEAAGDHLGHKVEISDDGSVIAVSAPDNDGNGGNSGEVYVYKNNGGSWVKTNKRRKEKTKKQIQARENKFNTTNKNCSKV